MLAAASGTVVGAAPNAGYGNWIRIDHAGNVATVYGHLSAFAPGVSAGTKVERGQLIGFVGNTGRSTGAHLHFEVINRGQATDPMTFSRAKRTKLAGADLESFRKLGQDVTTLSRLQLTGEVLGRLGQRRGTADEPGEDPDFVFYTGCNVLKTPHIALLALDVMDALGVTYRVMGGPTHCCGVHQLRG